MYARKPSRSHASHQPVHKQYQVVQSPPKLVIRTYNAPKQIPPIQLSEEHSLHLSDSRAGIRYNLMGKRGEPLTYEHPNQVIVTVLDKDGGGVRTGVYNHEDVSVSRIIDDIPKELTFQINSRQTRKDGITIDDADAVKTELINKLSIIPELTKEFLVASKDLSVIEPVPEVTSQTTAENKAEVNSKVAQSSEPLNAASQPLNVADMSVTEKLAETMKRAAMKLPKSVGEQLLAMVNPTSLFVMVGVLGAYAASHAVGIGVLADAVMAVGAGATIGWQGVSAAKELWGFAQFFNATTEEDLDKCGQHLANFVSTVGLDIVLGILFKKAAGKAKGAGNLDEAENINVGRVDDINNANSNTRIEIEGAPVLSTTDENYKFTNPTGNWSRELGINHYKTGKIIKQMSNSEIGQTVVDAVNANDIDLSLSLRNDIPRNLLGISKGNYGTAYVYNTQSYDQTVLTLIHEGLHAMGIGGSRRAEALVRLAELEHQGIPINKKTIRQVLKEMKNTGGYDHMPWRVGRESPNFPGVEF